MVSEKVTESSGVNDIYPNRCFSQGWVTLEYVITQLVLVSIAISVKILCDGLGQAKQVWNKF